MNALQYIEVSSTGDAKNLLKELARVIVRSRSYPGQQKVLESISKLQSEKRGLGTGCELSLKKKQIVCLPNEFFSCVHILQRLKLDGNLIKYFPHEVLSCSQLRELYLNGNQIEEIPRSIRKLSVLKCFEIESNKLEDLPCHAVRNLLNNEELDFYIKFFLYS